MCGKQTRYALKAVENGVGIRVYMHVYKHLLKVCLSMQGSPNQPALEAMEIHPGQGNAWASPRQHEDLPGICEKWGCREE